MYCIKCGSNNENGVTNCGSCGAPLFSSEAPPSATMVQSVGQPAAQPKASGMAVASLILGILGFLSFGFAAIAGLVLGGLALRQISRSRGTIGGQGLAIAGLVTSGIAVLMIPIEIILAAIVLPVFAQAREHAKNASCMSNLKQIGLATQMYAQDYDGHEPIAARWCDETMPYIKNDRVYKCPSAEWPDGRCDYAFNPELSGLSLEKVGNPASLAEVFDSKSNSWNFDGGLGLLDPRHNGGANIALADGHVQYFNDLTNGRQSESSSLAWTPAKVSNPSHQPGV